MPRMHEYFFVSFTILCVCKNEQAQPKMNANGTLNVQRTNEQAQPSPHSLPLEKSSMELVCLVPFC